MKIQAKTFAKVNPRLKILGKLDEEYHELDISFLSVNLGDRMIFEDHDENDIRVSTEASIDDEDNLCYQVASKLKGVCSSSRGATISLEKKIPVGGGLGGGSSNAAATLICLNRLWKCNLTRQSLVKIGEEFGADIPFFFYGGYCIGKGKGTKLNKIENVFIDRLVPLVIPPFSQSTAEVYSKFDQLTKDSRNRKTGGGQLYTPDLNPFTIENDLQRAAIELNPELKAYIKLLGSSSAIETAGLAGSGSSVFGISKQDVTVTDLKKELEEDLNSVSPDVKLIVTRPTNHGQLIREEE